MIARNWRSYCLAASSIGINLALVYSLLVPSAGNRQVAEYTFPREIPLASGNALADRASPQPTAIEEVIKAQQQYQYLQDGREIDLAVTYLVGTQGDVGTYLQNYTSIEPEVIRSKSLQQLAEVGYHVLFSDRHRAYLSSCISPRSPSSVTQKQFSQYRYQNDLQWQVGLNWLQGKASIRDRRCLWVLLSTPVTQEKIKNDYQALEVAWQDLYQWWRPNFPSLSESKI